MAPINNSLAALVVLVRPESGFALPPVCSAVRSRAPVRARPVTESTLRAWASVLELNVAVIVSAVVSAVLTVAEKT